MNYLVSHLFHSCYVADNIIQKLTCLYVYECLYRKQWNMMILKENIDYHLSGHPCKICTKHYTMMNFQIEMGAQVPK